MLEDELSVDCGYCKGKGCMITWNSDRERLEVQRCDNCNEWMSDYECWKELEPKR